MFDEIPSQRSSVESVLEKITNAMTTIALFIFYAIALPALFGVIAAVISMFFIYESFLMGEIGRGIFVLTFCFTAFLFFGGFLKSRGFTQERTTTADVAFRATFTNLSLLFLPIIIISLLFLGIGTYFQYPTYSYGFQIAIYLIGTGISLRYLQKSDLIFTDLASSSDPDAPSINITKYEDTSFARLIGFEFIIFIFLNIGLILRFQSSIISLYFCLGFYFLLLVVNYWLISRLKLNANAKVILPIYLIKILLLLAAFIMLLVVLYTPIVNLGLYLLFSMIFCLKFTFSNVYIQTKNLLDLLHIRLQWPRYQLWNQLGTITLYILGLLFAWLSYGAWLSIVIAMIFIGEAVLSRFYNLFLPNFQKYFTPVNLIVINALFSFTVIPASINLQIIIFTIGLLVCMPVIDFLKTIPANSMLIIKNVLYTALFFELGIYFALITATNLLLISDSVVFNYLFFIALSSLSSLYRLYVVQLEKQTTPLFSRLVIGHLLFVFFGIFLLFEDLLVLGIGLAVNRILASSDFFYLFRPSFITSIFSDVIASYFNGIGKLANISTFLIKSTNGLIASATFLIAALFTLICTQLAFRLHFSFGLIEARDEEKARVGFLGATTVCGIGLVLIALQSLTGFFLAFLLILGALYMLMPSLASLNWGKITVEKVFSAQQKLFWLILVDSLAFLTFAGLEIFLLDIASSLIIAFAVMLLYQNFIPRVNAKLTESKPERNVLNLLNAIWILALTILILPSSIALLERFTSYRYIDWIAYTTLFYLLLLCLVLNFGADQLFKGKFITETLIWEIKTSIRYILVLLVYVLCVYSLFQGTHYSSIQDMFNQMPARVFIECVGPMAVVYLMAIGFSWEAHSNNNYIVARKWEFFALFPLIFFSFGLSIAFILYFGAIWFYITLGLLLMAISYLLCVSYCKKMLPDKLYEIQTAMSYGVYFMVLLLVVIVYFFCIDIIKTSLISGLFWAINAMLVLLNTVPFIKDYFGLKKQIEVSAIGIEINGLILTAIILLNLNVQNLMNPLNIFAVLLIPIGITFYGIYLLEKQTLSKKTSLRAYQLTEFMFLIILSAIIYLLCIQALSIVVCLFIIAIIITIILLFDAYNLKWLAHPNLVLISFLIIGIADNLLFGLIIADLFSFTSTIQIGIFFMIQIGLLYVELELVEYIAQSPQNSLNPISDIADRSPIMYLDYVKEVLAQKRFITTIFSLTQISLTVYLVFSIEIAYSFAYFWIPCLLSVSLVLSALLGLSSTRPDSGRFGILYIQTIFALIFAHFGHIGLSLVNASTISSSLIILAIFNLLGSSQGTKEPLIRYPYLLSIIGLSFSSFSIFTENWLHLLIFASTFLICTTHPRFMNLTFYSLLPWSISIELIFWMYQLTYFIAITSVIIPLAFGFTCQWILCWLYPQWKQTLLKKIAGFTALWLWIGVYIGLFAQFPFIFGPALPFVLLIVIGVLTYLKPLLPHRINAFNIFILFSTLIIGLMFGYSYLFPTLIYRLILSISLSLTICGFLFLYLFKKLEVQVLKHIIVGSLLTATLASGIFMYYILIEPNLAAVDPLLAFSIAMDIGILAFYVSIGVFQGNFTRKIWETGWYVWNFLPIVNFTLISRLVSGIDHVTLALQVLNTDLNGSIILSVIICSFMYLPVVIYKLKNQMEKIIYGLWLELLVFVLWGATNLFQGNLFAIWIFTILVGLVLIAPLLYYFKQWVALSELWFPLGIINIVFLTYFFRLPFEWMFPLNYLVMGLYFIVFSYFPNIRKQQIFRSLDILIVGFLIVYLALFGLLYSFMVRIFIDPLVSVNITFIVMSFGLLGGKYLSFDETVLKFLLSWISIINIGILVARSFGLIENFALFGIFLGIAASCGALRAFQARGYLPRLYEGVIWIIMAYAFGLALAELILTLTNMGEWFARGVLIIVFAAISYPVSEGRKDLVYSLSLIGVACLLVEALLLIPIIAAVGGFVLFLNTALILLGLYFYIPRLEKDAVFGSRITDFEVVALIEGFLTVLLPITSVVILVLMNMYDGVSIFFFYVISTAILLLVNDGLMKKKALFHWFPSLKKWYDNLHDKAILAIYLSIAVLFALNLPVPMFGEPFSIEFALTILYRFIIFFSISLLEILVIDAYGLKIVGYQARFAVGGLLYYALSCCLALFIGLLTLDGALALIVLCFMNFGFIRLIKKISSSPSIERIKIANVAGFILGVFIELWVLLGVDRDIAEIRFDTLALSLCIPCLFVYLFIKLHYVGDKGLKFVVRIFQLSCALQFEEIARIYFNAPIVTLIGIWLLIFTILNIMDVSSGKSVYIWWGSASVSITLLITGGAMILFPGSIGAGDLVLIFFIIFALLLSIITYALAERAWLSLLLQFSPEAPLYLISLFQGFADQQKSRKFFVSYFAFAIIIFSIGISRLWNALFSTFLAGIGRDEILIRQVFLWLSGTPLVFCILSALLMKYINIQNLWVENPKFREMIPRIQNALGLCIYLLLPLFSASNLHFLLLPYVAIVYIVFIDCIVFFVLFLICLYVVDLPHIQLLERSLAEKLCLASIVAIGISVAVIVLLSTMQLFLAMLTFSLISLLAFKANLVPSTTYDKWRAILILSFYLEICLQIIWLLFTYAPISIAFLVSAGIIHGAVEFEHQRIFLLDQFKKVTKIRPYSWLAFSSIFNIVLVTFMWPLVSGIQISGALLLFTLSLFYFIRLKNDVEPGYQKINRNGVGLLVYVQLAIFYSTLYLPLLWGIDYTSPYLFAFALFGFVFLLILFSFGLLELDARYFHFLKNDFYEKLRQPLRLAFFAILSVELALLTYIGLIWAITPTTTGENIALIMGAVLIGTLTATLAIHHVYQNKTLDQVLYSVLAIEILVILAQLGLFTLLGITAGLALLLYPFIFFMEQVQRLLVIIGDWIRRKIDSFKEFMRLLYESLREWYLKFERGIFILFASIAAIVLFILVGNYFLSGLAFLLILWKFSPEKDDDITNANFRNKIVYRTALYICLIGTGIIYLPPMGWLYALCILVFLGYLIWIVRNSEDLYGLPIYWRFFTSLFAIIDFGVLVYLLWQLV